MRNDTHIKIYQKSMTIKSSSNWWFHDFLLILWKCQNLQENQQRNYYDQLLLSIIIKMIKFIEDCDWLWWYGQCLWQISNVLGDSKCFSENNEICPNQWFHDKSDFWRNYQRIRENVSQNHWYIICCHENDGKSIENNQKMISLSHLTKGKSK